MQPGGLPDIDTKTPSGARVYDYMLGGTDNYVVDRIVAEQTEMMMPGTKALARTTAGTWTRSWPTRKPGG